MKNRARLCPSEKSAMQQVKAESHYGQSVILDQCAQCGGIWFDDFELYMTREGQAAKIELLDVESLRRFSVLENKELVCPADQTRLVHFSDPFFPKEIIIARCPACNGFWLNRGEFTRYQRFRQALKEPVEITTEDDKLQQDISRILAEHKTGDLTDTLGKLGRFLSTPMDSLSWQPLAPEKLSPKEKSLLEVILNSLPLLLRLFIRF